MACMRSLHYSLPGLPRAQLSPMPIHLIDWPQANCLQNFGFLTPSKAITMQGDFIARSTVITRMPSSP